MGTLEGESRRAGERVNAHNEKKGGVGYLSPDGPALGAIMSIYKVIEVDGVVPASR